MHVGKIPTKQLGRTSNNILLSVSCDSSVNPGDIVRLTSIGVFIKAQADNYINARVFGICNAKSSPTLADILLPGGVTDEVFTGLNILSDYYLSNTTPGGIIVPPVPDSSGEVVVFIGRPYTDKKLLFIPEVRWRL